MNTKFVFASSQKNIAIALVALVPAIFSFSPTALAEPAQFESNAFASYKPNLKNGEYMFNAAGCAACHGSAADPKLLSGGLEMRTAIGTFKVPNITASTKGIGGWSNAAFLNAVMVGIKPNGDNLYPVMPYVAYAGMKPEDVLDIKAYIDTLPKSDASSGRNEISFPFNQQFAVTLWKRANFSTKPYESRGNSQLERGRYLVENVAGCGQCHTGRTLTFALDKSKPYAGEKGLTGEYAPAIDAARLTSLASPKAFIEGTLVKGLKLNGSPIASGTMKRISQGTARLTEKDRTAMFAYLAKKEVKLKPQIAMAACAAKAAPVAAASSALTSAADDFVGTYCRSCHGPGESAQGSFSAGDIASIASNPSYVTPGNPEKSLLYTVVTSGRMPEGKKPRSSEVAQLRAWIKSLKTSQLATAAESKEPARQRPIITYSAETESALKDLNGLNEFDRQYVRYFSYRAEYNAVLGCETNEQFAKRLRYYKAGLRKLLNSLSYGPKLVIPTAVAGTQATLVRVDLRDLKWSAADWDRMISHYFYGISPQGDPELEALVQGTGTRLPVVRADWFMSNASRPPLYDAFMKYSDNIHKVERDILRVDSAADIQRLNIVRAGFGTGSSGVSDHNRLIERHDLSDGGYYWISYDFKGDVGRQNLKRFPHGPDGIGPLPAHLKPFEHAGGEMIFSLPNGMQGYYLANNKGDRLDVGPTSIVSFRSRPIGKGIEVINGRSCFDCHANGIIAKRDELRHSIETSALFSRDQLDVLLKMYVPQDRLDSVYEGDLRHFVAALDKIGAAEKAPDGSLQSLKVPGKAGGSEVITYYADLYEKDLDIEALAAEFDMTPAQFKEAARRLRGDALPVALDWIARLEGGARIPRHEIEREYATMLEPLTQHVPLGTGKSHAVASAGVKHTTNAAPSKSTRVDYSSVEGFAAGRLKLAIKVPSSYVKVGSKLSFTISSNKDCELQLLYIQSDGTVKVFPQAFIGNRILHAGENRQIPPPSAGQIVFDSPAQSETMVAFCKVGGLGKDRLTAEGAKKLARAARQPVTRGISFKLAEKGKVNGGKSAVNFVTFEVDKK